MEHHKVTCDHCGADLTSTGNSVDYRLVLDSERIPLRGSTCTDMMIYPPIDRAAHFCGTACLFRWLKPRLTAQQRGEKP